MASNETIYGEMTAEEARYFEAECKRFPWLSQVTMSDYDLCSSIDRDIRPGVSFNLFSGWRLHYGWVFINILKYFYEHGEFKHFDHGYIDGQIAAERALRGHLGAIVVLSAESGAVRVMASSPTFPPGDFVPSISRVRYRELVEDPGNPFLNRAVQGSYMPGSTIKPLTALAALENGIPETKTYDC